MTPSAISEDDHRLAQTDRRRVVVGVESAGDSRPAVEWGAREATARRAPLILVHTWDWSAVPARYQYGAAERKALEAEGLRILLRAKEQALAAGARDVQFARQRGYAPDVLVDLSADASLLVVGTHHASPLARAVFGSVGTAAVSRAACPVVVVSGPPGMPEEGPAVVAGVSGEPHDQDVLAFAFDHASRHRLALHAVFCWNPIFGDLTLSPPELAKVDLSRAVAGWRNDYPEVETHFVVRNGDPVDALVETAASQALLVVGRHAPRMHFGAVLGSTCLGVVHHATCPVAVIPPTPAVTEREPVTALQAGIVTP